MDEKEEVVDLYDILGVKKTATSDEIKTAYKAKAKILHPDMEDGDEEKFKQLQEAYDVLIDEELRVLYDATGEKEKIDYTERIIGFLQSNVVSKITNAQGFIKIDLIKRITQDIDANEQSFLNSIQTAEQSIEKVRFVLNRVKLKQGENVEDLFRESLEEKIGDLESEIKFAHLELSFVQSLRDFINKYEYIIEDLIEATEKSKRYSILLGAKTSKEKDEKDS